MSNRILQGAGGGGGPHHDDDDLFATDKVELVIALSQGPIGGPVDGKKSIKFGNTALQNQSGENNFDNVDVTFYPGDPDPDPVVFKLGGASTNQNISQTLQSNVPVIRTTFSGNVDYLDVRMAVQQLVKTTEAGSTEDAQFDFSIRYKPHTAASDEWATWSESAYMVKDDNPYFTRYDTWTDNLVPDPVTGRYTDPNHGNQTWMVHQEWHQMLTWAQGQVGANEHNPQIIGKTSSTYPKEYRIPVQRLPVTYDVEVTRLAQENNNLYTAVVQWESMQEIDAKPKSYPNTAVLHIVGEAGDQFTSVPDVGGEYYGIICRVPSNFNPSTGKYVGTWNGTWQYLPTRSPVWFLYELIHNTEWGWSSVSPAVWDQYEAYALAQITDELLPPYNRPRYTFNANITESMDAREFMQWVAGSFNSVIIDDNNGNLHVLMDKDDAAVALVGKESTIHGFEYTYTDTATRYNDIRAIFNNPYLDYEQDRRRIKDDDHIEQFGRIPLDFVAVGCTDDWEATRKASRRLVSATTETEMVNFQTNRIAEYWDAYDIILVADTDRAQGFSGRANTYSADRKTVYLRDPIYIESGSNYTIYFQHNNALFTTTITNSTVGFTSQLTLQTAVPANIDDYAQFSLSDASMGGYGIPKPFRIINRVNEDGNPDNWNVSAIAINRNKFAAEDTATLVDIPDYTFDDTGAPDAPHAVRAYNSTHIQADGSYAYEATVDFSPSSNRFVSEYQVRFKDAGGTHGYQPTIPHFTTGSTISIPYAAKWTFEVRAVSLFGDISPWATSGNISIRKPARTPTPILSGTAVSKLKKVVLSWVLPDDADLSKVIVYRSDDSNFGHATQIAKTKATHFTDNHVVDDAIYYYWVSSQDTHQQEAVPYFLGIAGPGSITGVDLDHTPPDPVTGLALTQSLLIGEDGTTFITVNATVNQLNIANTPNEDLAGYEFQIRENSGNWSTTYNSYPNNFYPFTSGIKSGRTYDVRVRSMDQIGNRSAWSSSVSITTTKKGTPPAQVTSLNIQAIANRNVLTYTPPTDKDIKWYKVYRYTGSGGTFAANATFYATNTGSKFVDNQVTVGQAYQYWITSVDRTDNENLTTPPTVTATTVGTGSGDLDTTPCDVPTNNLPTQTVEVMDDGTATITLNLTCVQLNTAVSPNQDLDGYEFQIQETGTGKWVSYYNTYPNNFYYVVGVKTAKTYDTRVRSIDVLGNKSAWSTTRSLLTTKKGTAPGAVTGLAGQAVANRNVLSFTPPTDKDYKFAKIYRYAGSGGTFASNATFYANTDGTRFVDAQVTVGQSYQYWVTTVDRSGNENVTTPPNTTLVTVGTGSGDLDKTPCDVPTGLGVTQTISVLEDGTSHLQLNASWGQLNTATSPNQDLLGYELQVHDGSGNWQSYFNAYPNNFYPLTAGIKTATTYSMRVRSIDIMENQSAWTSIVSITTTKKQTPPAQVSGLSIQAIANKNVLTWTDPTDKDFKWVKIYRYTGSGGTFAANATYYAKSSDSKFVDNQVTVGTTYQYWVTTVDRTANENITTPPTVTATTVGTGDGDLDKTPCDVPAGLAITQTTYIVDDSTAILQLNLTCTQLNTAVSPNTDLLGYEFQVNDGSGNWQSYFNPYPNNFYPVTSGVRSNTTYTVRVRSVDTLQNKSAWSGTQSLLTTKKQTPPGQVSSLSIQAISNRNVLNWSEPTDKDYKYAKIYRYTGSGGTFATNAVFYAKTGDGKFVDNQVTVGTTYQYWVTAVDRSGNENTTTPPTVTTTAVGTGQGDLDRTPCDVPTGLAVTQVTTVQDDGSVLLGLNVTCNQINIATSPNQDLLGYEFHVNDGSGNWQAYFNPYPNNYYPVTSGIKSGVTYSVRVRSIDAMENQSAWSSTVTIGTNKKGTPPNAVTGLASQAVANRNVLTWTDPTNKDYKYAKIYRYTGSGGTFAANATYYAKTSDDKFADNQAVVGTTYQYWVTTVDRSDNENVTTPPTATVTTIGTGSGDLDKTPPDVPTLNAPTQSLGVDLDGKIVITVRFSCVALNTALTQNTDLAYYEFAVKEGSGGEETIYPNSTPNNFYNLVGVKSGTQYYVRVRSRDLLGNVSAWSSNQNITVSKKGTPPTNPTASVSPIAKGITNLVKWIPQLNQDIAGINVYRATGSTLWASATFLANVGLASQFSDREISVGSSYSYWVTAYDKSGNENVPGTFLGTATAIGMPGADISDLPLTKLKDVNGGSLSDNNLLNTRTNDTRSWNRNPTFQRWTGTVPDNWGANGGISAVKNMSTPRYGEWDLDLTATATPDAQYIVAGSSSNELRVPNDGDYMAVEYEFTLISGDLKGSGLNWRSFFNSGITNYKSYRVNFYDEHPSPVAGQVYSGTVLMPAIVTGTPTGEPTSADCFLAVNWSAMSGGLSAASKTIRFHKALWRKATREEVKAYRAIDINGNTLQSFATIIAPTSGYTDTLVLTYLSNYLPTGVSNQFNRINVSSITKINLQESGAVQDNSFVISCTANSAPGGVQIRSGSSVIVDTLYPGDWAEYRYNGANWVVMYSTAQARGLSLQGWSSKLDGVAAVPSASPSFYNLVGITSASGAGYITVPVTGFGTAAFKATGTATGQVPLAETVLLVANNLSDVANKNTARNNLGIDGRTAHGNSNYTMVATDSFVVTAVNVFTATRTWTLPAASAVNGGYELIVADELGTVTGTNTLIVARAGTDTISGATSYTINHAYGYVRLMSNGVDKWTIVGAG